MRRRAGSRRAWALAVAWSLAVFASAAACGGDDGPGADAGEIRVTQTFLEEFGLYAEGARSYVAARTPAGDEVVEAELEPAGEAWEATIRLDPGTYRLVSWQRPCDGNCESLDPPTDGCERDVTVEPRASLSFAVEVRPGAGCTIEPGR